MQSILIAEQRYRDIAIIQSIQPLALTSGILLGWAVGSLTLSWILTAAATSMALSIIAATLLTRISPFGDREPISRVFKEGITYSGSQIAETAAVTLIQIMAVGIIGPYSAGLLAIAITVSSLPLTAAHTIAAVIYKDASLYDRTSTLLTGAVVRTTLTTVAIPIIILSIISPLAVPTIFGAEFGPAVRPTLIALAGSTFLALSFVMAQILAAQNRGPSMTMNQIAGLACSVLLLVVTGPSLEADGAALALAMGWLITSVLHMITLRVPIRRLVPKPRDIKQMVAVVVRGKLNHEAF